MATRRRSRTLVADAQQVTQLCTGLHIRMAARGITQFFDARLRGSGLGFAQFGLLAQIAAARDDTIGGLAAGLGLDQSTLSRNLRILQRDRLVEIVTAETDLRRRAVWLTEQGARRLEQAMPAWRAAHAALAARVDASAVLAVARAVAAALREDCTE